MSNLIALEVIGDAMEPVLLEGDTVQVDPEVLPSANGKDLAVFNINGQYHVCRYTRFGNQILMLHDNGPIRVVRDFEAKLIGSIDIEKVLTSILTEEEVNNVINYIKGSNKEENHSAGNTMVVQENIY